MSDSDIEMIPGPSRGLAYDPDQDPGEKRKVRMEYRSLHRDTEGIFWNVSVVFELKSMVHCRKAGESKRLHRRATR